MRGGGLVGLSSEGRRGLTVRGLMTLLSVAFLVYVAAFVVVTSVRMRRVSAAIELRTAPIPALFGDLEERAISLNSMVLAMHDRIPEGSVARAAAGQVLRERLMRLENRASPGSFAAVPPAMRERLARADDLAATLQIRLLEYAAHLELGQPDRARGARAPVDSLAAELHGALVEAQIQGVRELVQGGRAVREAAAAELRLVLVWLVVSGLLLAGGLAVLWHRLAAPLRALHGGLAQVEEGDLSIRLPVARQDELGQLTSHFNRMTDVLQERAQEQGRFVAAGELVAGAAHEVNNPLMAISALCELRIGDESLPADVRQEFGLVRRQALRAGRLLMGLLRFVRPAEDQVALVSVNDVAREALDLLGFRFVRHEISVDLALADNLPPVAVTASRLEQVLVNLIGNAVDALTGTGVPRQLRLVSWAEGDTVRLAVEDNGSGIADGMADRLFRPFVTTKGKRGTGLGLYISREIARAAGGDLALAPTAEAPGRFLLTLPRAAGELVGTAEPEAAPAPQRVEGRPLEGVRLLLVDDEQPVRDPLARFLRRRGAEVREAENGLVALELLAEQPADVIVADLRMPRMDGAALYEEICRLYPALASRILFLSGDLAVLGEAHPSRGGRLITKPVDLSELEARVAALLR